MWFSAATRCVTTNQKPDLQIKKPGKFPGCILRKLCEWKSVRILEAECCADHIHMLVEIPGKRAL
ncbi:hypothetical protein BZL34_19740 [Escherichia coli]|nr:hypothetical protein BZL34_19740 [Escherichia coli]